MDPWTSQATPVGKVAAKSKPPAIWLLITFLAGAAGALGSVAAMGHGSYDIEPFRVELHAGVPDSGSTQYTIKSVQGLSLPASHFEAPTHSAPMSFRASVTGITPGFSKGDAGALATPQTFHDFLTNEGKTAVRTFALKLAGLALGGGAAAGAALSFVGMRWRRVIGAALSGLLVFAALGVWIQQTYDSSKFANQHFVVDAKVVPSPGSVPSVNLSAP